jgi:hypothetical protein
MAELTVLEEKLAEVLGLAMAAQDTTRKVEGLTDDESLAQTLERMRDEAEQTEERCTGLAPTTSMARRRPCSTRPASEGRGHRDDEDIPR